VKEREGSSYPAWVRFDKSQQKSFSEFMPWLKQTMKADDAVDFKLLKKESDKYGMEHYRYQQMYKGIPIENATYMVHVKNGNVTSFNGHAISASSKLTIASSISVATALEFAKKCIGAKQYKWENEFWENAIKENKKNKDATYFPKGELCWYSNEAEKVADKKSLTLAFKFDIYSANPDNAERVYVDAGTGTILKRRSLVAKNCEPATVNTIFNGNKTIYTEQFMPFNWRLNDDCQTAAIHVMDWGNYSDPITPTPQEIISNNNTWNTSKKDTFGTCVLWAIKETYNYFHSEHGRASYDDGNGNITAYINAAFDCSPPGNPNSCTYYDQASMDGLSGIMKVGWGSSTLSLLNSYSALDIIAHEYTHAITDNTPASLFTEDEPGALNESFSDIFGEVVENFVTGQNDWVNGGDVNNSSYRNLSSPNNSTDPQADTYLGDFWEYTQPPCNNNNDNCGVHSNCGVQNFWFYLLVNGGNDINDKGKSYNVNSINMGTAAEVAYRNLTFYLASPLSDYFEAREGSIQAAIDIS
ncbi:MAG: M4 family metallopeptidase, partial [Bacteroidota bacterium]